MLAWAPGSSVANPPGPKIRGSILLARLAFVREKNGAEAVEKILNTLSREDQAVLRGKVWEGGSYAFELNERLDRAIANTLSPKDPNRVFVEMGRASAETNLLGPQKTLVTPGDPHRFLAQAPYIYMLYYAKGRRTYEKLGPTRGVMKTFDAEVVSAQDCLTVVGWYERGLEICGAQGVRIEERHCRARGHAFCEYVCEWAA